jgi:hypothetical protein
MTAEFPRTPEYISYVALDTYLEFIASLNTYEGRTMEDEDHTFYHWVTSAQADLQHVDGDTSLADLYDKNVLEHGMTKERFYQYCTDHNFPQPNPTNETNRKLLEQFVVIIDQQLEEKRLQYEDWAAAHHITTTPGTVTTFIDAEGNRLKFRTDWERYGEQV